MIDRILTVGGITLLSRVTGFLRDIMLAAVLGAGPVADAFFVALRLPNHFRAIFAEGAFNAAFIPAYARVRVASGPDAVRLFSDRIFTLLLASQVVLLAVALVVHALGDRSAGAGISARSRASSRSRSISRGSRFPICCWSASSRSTAASSMRWIVSPPPPRRRSCSTCR